LLCGLLRFVPYVGPWVGALAPIAVSITVFETWTMPVVIAGFFVVLELARDEVFDPLFLGASVGLSPFAVILAVIFWGWLWGPLGLVLAIPLTACLVVLGRHVPRPEGLSILLSDTEPLRPAERLYQRLLARDIDEATDLVAEQAKEQGPLSAWDQVVLPALCLVDRDEQRRLLEADELECARETAEVLLGELPEARVADDSQRAQSIPCLPARGWSDEIACRALARFLGSAGLPAHAAGRRLASELAEAAAGTGARTVCIWSLDLLGGGAVRHLAMRVRKRCPTAAILVGVSGDDSWTEQLRQRFAGDPLIQVVCKLAAAQERLLGSAAPQARAAPAEAGEP
jgi:hypothetical protein